MNQKDIKSKPLDLPEKCPIFNDMLNKNTTFDSVSYVKSPDISGNMSLMLRMLSLSFKVKSVLFLGCILPNELAEIRPRCNH